MTDIKNFKSLANELLPRFTGDSVSDIRTIYEYLDACDPDTRTLLLSDPGSIASKDFFHTLFTSENCAFSKYCADPEKGELIEAYLNAIPGMYASYKKAHPDDADLDALAEKAAEMVMMGIDR